jgi:DNA adenine methylase
MLNKFPKISDRIRNVVIENRDFEPLIKAYDRPDALFYLDPPYYSAEKYYDGFGKSDHERLRKALENLKGRFILSYNDSDAIKSLYRNFNVSEISRGNNLSKGNGRKYQELIVTNY